MENFRLMNRTDTKYVLSFSKVPAILEGMNGNYRILTINGRNLFFYHTTYLDTPEYLFFNQHVTGKRSRHKVRYRKYEINQLTFLEVKKKTNKDRTVKWRMEDNLAVDGKCSQLAKEFINKHVPLSPLTLRPVLLNTFSRLTFVGTDISERVTVDFGIAYSDHAGKSESLKSVAVIEIKKDTLTARSPVADMLKASAVYPGGFSKYCMGSALLNRNLRINILKPKLLLINKIENENL